MKVHEASSLYSEEKAKILRSVGSKIEEKDQYLNTYLTSLKLEHMNLWDPDTQTSDWECLPLPEELVERCAALNAKQDVIQDLVDIMGKLSDTSQDVEGVLKEISKLLQDEELKCVVISCPSAFAKSFEPNNVVDVTMIEKYH